MTYNLHPIFVHFPIALLFIYSFIKIVPFKKWFPSVSWVQIETALLVFGVLGAFAALATGDTAEHLVRPNRNLVEMHSTFAGISVFLYCVLLGAEILSYINKGLIQKLKIIKLQRLSVLLADFIKKPFISGVFAFLGLVAITVTGLLGGVIVYGTTADPLAKIVLQILHINL